jgi:importin subunit alpha-1
MVISANAVDPIATMLNNSEAGSSFTRNASWTLSNFCRGRPSPNFSKVRTGVNALAKVIMENDAEDILIDVCWALSYISDGGEDRIPVIL